MTAESPPPARHGYFVLQATALRAGPGMRLTGVVEDVATGTKWRFGSVEELGDVFRRWGFPFEPSPRNL